MCIRDSTYTDRGQLSTVNYPNGATAGYTYDNAGRLTDIVPVSYTHLRAHETVLDLVCRLLLEKKKHRTQNHNISFSIRLKDRPTLYISPLT